MMAHGRLALENMLYVLKYLLTHPCEDCGETDPRVLEFDHVGKKTFTIGDALTRGNLHLDVLREEINHCLVRCANCHRRKHCKHSYKAMTIAQLQREIDSRAPRPILRDPLMVPAEGCTDGPQSSSVSEQTSSVCEQGK